MMVQCSLRAGLVEVAVVTPGFADTTRVLQPNNTDYSPETLATLLPAIDTPATVIDDYHRGGRRYFNADEWDSVKFAAPATYLVTRTVTGSRGTRTSIGYQFAVRKPSVYTPTPRGGCGGHK